MAGQASHLLGTKTRLPPARPGLVARPRLVARLTTEAPARLTLVSAPAGFGKTTLLAEWLAAAAAPVAWLSLDPGDNDPARFLRYLVAAVRRALPGAGEDTVAALQTLPLPPPAPLLTGLLNDLAESGRSLVLVLDDYHVIEATPVHDAVAFLLENLPPGAGLVISTRADPPLPLSLLRSRGDLVEVRADALRFTPAEAEAFLNRAMTLALAPPDVACLTERTEGWIAGLKLAALSLRGREDAPGFVRAFSGSHRYVLDFLVEEVLSRQRPEVQAFLLDTCVPERICGPLCDALTGTAGSQVTLEALERANLFVVPLDDDRRWYRYHNLFRELLRSRLLATQPQRVPPLQRRTADWLVANDLSHEAVDYLLQAEDYAAAMRLIERCWIELTQAGEVSTSLAWLQRLPAGLMRTSPLMSVYMAWGLCWTGRIAAMEPHLNDAEAALSGPAVEQAADDRGLLRLARVSLPSLRSMVARQRGDFEAALALAEAASALADPSDPVAWAPARLMLASTYLVTGNLAGALAGYDDAEAAFWDRGHPFGAIHAACSACRVLRLQGHLRQAQARAEATLARCSEGGLSRLPAAGLVHLALAEILCDRNDLTGVRHHLDAGLALSRRGGYFGVGEAVLARLRQAEGDLAGALAAASDAREAISDRDSWLTGTETEALRLRLLVAAGRLEESSSVADHILLRQAPGRGTVAERQGIALARVRLAQGRADEAVRLLASLLANAEQDGRLASAIEVLVLRALAYDRRGQKAEAGMDVRRALRLGEPDGWVRVFADEGEPLARLLREVAGPVAAGSSGYVATLVAACGPALPLAADAAAPPSEAGAAAPAEALTHRELEVLRSLASGLSNQELAGRLFVTVGTVKAHTHSIYGKLGVRSRAQALARARELRLL